RLRRGLREADVADFAGLYELGHGADGFLDRHIRIDPVLVEEVDVADAEALERSVDRAPDVLGAAVDAARPGARRVDREAELGGHLELVPTTGDRAPDEPLVGVWPVDLGGVEECHAELERAVDRPKARLLVALAVGPGHAHAAEALGGYLEPLASQSCPVH